MWGSISNFKNSVSSTMREILTDSDSSSSECEEPPTFFQSKPLEKPSISRPATSLPAPRPLASLEAPEIRDAMADPVEHDVAKPDPVLLKLEDVRPPEPLVPSQLPSRLESLPAPHALENPPSGSNPHLPDLALESPRVEQIEKFVNPVSLDIHEVCSLFFSFIDCRLTI
jgi:hypothetical protein